MSRFRLFLVLSILGLGVIAWIAMPDGKVMERINGASVVNPPRPIDAKTVGEVRKMNVDWIAVIPYGFSRAGQPEVSFDHSRQWWGEQTSGNSMLIQYAKENNLKVMCKPHVWVRGQGWAGDFDLSTEEDWKVWEQGYTKYIINHAIKADSMDVELFCIGTEYRIPAREREDFWRGLIKQVRRYYSGKITYASNWDNYQNIEWWDELDYIGIDAYFPLVEGKHPSIDEIKKGWQPIKEELSLFAKQWNKSIVFTEYGFQSIDGAVGDHWKIDKSSVEANEQLQADAYEATFQALEHESWFVGGFFWKWHFIVRNNGWYQRDDWGSKEWTPQNKPAADVIAKWYGK